MDPEFDPRTLRQIALSGPDSPFQDLLSILAFLRHAPTVIGEPAVENLFSFLYGFAYAQANMGNGEALEMLSAFQVWVTDRYRIETTQRWGKIIQFFAASEAEGLDRFWALYDEFLSGRTAD